VRVGYIRASSVDHNTVRQLDGVALERTFIDKASGKDTIRPALDEMLAFVRDGDTVIVHSMDRLARNLDDLRRVVRSLTGKGVRVEFVKETTQLIHRRHNGQRGRICGQHMHFRVPSTR